jgi:hypothetical protein
MYSEDERCLQSSLGSLNERDHLEDPDVDGRIILIRISKTWDGSKDWIVLAQDGDRWQDLVNAVMSLRVP